MSLAIVAMPICFLGKTMGGHYQSLQRCGAEPHQDVFWILSTHFDVCYLRDTQSIPFYHLQTTLINFEVVIDALITQLRGCTHIK